MKKEQKNAFFSFFFIIIVYLLCRVTKSTKVDFEKVKNFGTGRVQGRRVTIVKGLHW